MSELAVWLIWTVPFAALAGWWVVLAVRWRIEDRRRAARLAAESAAWVARMQTIIGATVEHEMAIEASVARWQAEIHQQNPETS